MDLGEVCLNHDHVKINQEEVTESNKSVLYMKEHFSV